MKEGFNIKSSLKIQFDSKKQLDTIIDVLTPDNIHIPEGLKIDIKSHKKYLVIDIDCKNGAGTFLNTMDELLEHISLSSIVTSND
jgi:hypothetical protein